MKATSITVALKRKRRKTFRNEIWTGEQIKGYNSRNHPLD